ncbi:MAG: hypothetical protein ACFBRM_12955 [Pikeienuella sp.]
MTRSAQARAVWPIPVWTIPVWLLPVWVLALCLAAPATAEIRAQYYDREGLLAGEEILYRGAAHRALVIATETGQSARDPADREELVALLGASGMDVTEIEATAGLSDEDLSDAAFAWANEANRLRDGGLLVVIDSRLRPGPGGPGDLVLARTTRSEAPFDLSRFLAALDVSSARHVLVVFTTRVDERDVSWGARARSPDPRRAWLTREALLNRGREAIVPWGADVGVLRHLTAALSDGPGYAANAPEHFDPDPFVTAADLAGAGGRGLDHWTFGDTHDGGAFVLIRREVPETRFDNRPGVSEAYAAAQAALRLGDTGALERFFSGGEETRWHLAARLQNDRLQARLLAAEGRRCDAALTFAPPELLSLNAGVVGRLDAFDNARDLALRWLSAARAASGVGPREARDIEAACARAITSATEAPERALKLALLEESPRAAFRVALDARPGFAAEEAEAAAVLAGLRLLTDGPGAEGPSPILRRLDAAVEAGSGSAALLRALVLFDGTYLARSSGAAMRDLTLAAERGVAVADALKAAVWLSPHQGPATWRGDLTSNRQAAFDAMRNATAARLSVDPALLALEDLGDVRLRECSARLAALDPAALFDARQITSLDALDRLLNAPVDALTPAVRRVPEASARAACAQLPAPGELTPEAAALRDDVLLRLALLDLVGGRTAQAQARLDDILRPSAEARLVAALLARPQARAGALAAAAEAGSELAQLAAALIALEAASPGAPREAARAPLAALGDGGLPVADAALAAALLSDARVSPGLSGQARAAADAALLEGLLRIAAADRQGVGLGLDPAEVGRVVGRAPAVFGLGLADLTSAHRRLLGPGLPARNGGALLQAPADGRGLRVGDVLLAVQGVPVESKAEAEQALFQGLFQVLGGGGALSVRVWRAGAAMPIEVSLPLPRRMGQLRFPAALTR